MAQFKEVTPVGQKLLKVFLTICLILGFLSLITVNIFAEANETNLYPLQVYSPLSKAVSAKHPSYFLPDGAIKPMADFWINVYANYDLHQTIFHDNLNPEIIYGVLDFETLWKDEARTETQKRLLRSRIEEVKKEKLREMLLRFAEGEKPVTDGEKLVFKLFDNRRGSEKFEEAADRIRGQWGQKSKFESGLVRSGRYWPAIQAIFAREGVPQDVAYLVFVESMFTTGAFSKVGAAGPWQFMPRTARLEHLRIDHNVDERRDPLIAAEAAAKLLHKNFELLGNWPLAINAYNTGPLRMMKAMRQMETKKIEPIIRYFKDGGYQFASRNFYPEFLAAMEVGKNFKHYFSNVEVESPMAFESLTLPEGTSLYNLAEVTATDIGVLKAMNPAYSDHLFRRGATLPGGSLVRIPSHQKGIFVAALDEMKTVKHE